MANIKHIINAILSGEQDKNISFADLQKAVTYFGFGLVRVRGDHFIYSHKDIPEIVNIQPLKGKAKPYQVKQVRQIILMYFSE